MPNNELYEKLKKDFPRIWKAFENSEHYDLSEPAYHSRYFFDTLQIFISVGNYPVYKVKGFEFPFNGYRWRFQIYYNTVQYKINSGFASREEAERAAILEAFEMAEKEVFWVPPAKEKSYEQRTQYTEYVYEKGKEA